METCTCGHTFTLYDTIIRISRARRPNRPRVYCQRCWSEVRARFFRFYDRIQSRQMVRITFAQYGEYDKSGPSLPVV